MQPTHRLAAFALASLLALSLAPVAAATHEPMPEPFQMCPSGSCDNYAAAFWYWLTHTAWPLGDPCLPNAQPACM